MSRIAAVARYAQAAGSSVAGRFPRPAGRTAGSRRVSSRLEGKPRLETWRVMVCVENRRGLAAIRAVYWAEPGRGVG